MEKRKRIFIISALVVVVAIIVVAVAYPPVREALTGGTIGKVRKYGQQQMTEKDLVLRSQIVSDSARLRSTIQALMFFNLFAIDLTGSLDSNISELRKSCMCEKKTVETVEALEDYVKFIRNNNKTLQTTITMLLDFYTNDTSTASLDVEKNLREFDTYVQGFIRKDSVVDNLVTFIDDYLSGMGGHKGRKSEIDDLKKIRNNLLIKDLQFAGLVGNKKKVEKILTYVMRSAETVNSSPISNVGTLCNTVHQAVAVAAVDAVNSTNPSATASVNAADHVSSAAGIGVVYVNNVFTVGSAGIVSNAGSVSAVPICSVVGNINSVYINSADIFSSAASINSQGIFSQGSVQGVYYQSAPNLGINVSGAIGNIGTIGSAALSNQSGIQAVLGQ